MTAGIHHDAPREPDASGCREGRELLDRCIALVEIKRLSEGLEAGLRSVEILSAHECDDALADALEQVATIHYYGGRYSEAIAFWQRALALHAKSGEILRSAKAHRNAGISYSRIGSSGDALRELEAGLLFFTRAGDKAGSGACLNSIGIVHYRLGSYDVAMARSLEAVALLSEPPGNRAHLAEAWLNISHIFGKFGNPVAAMEHADRALEVAERYQYAEIYNDMAAIHTSQGDYRNALASYLLAFRTEKDSPRAFGRAVILGNIGNTYARMGKHAIALRYQRLNCACLERFGDREHLSRSLRNLADSYFNLDRADEGVSALHRAIAEATAVDAQWEIGRAHSALHEYYVATRDFERALEHYSASVAIREKLVGAEKEKAVESLQLKFEMERRLKEEEIRQSNNVVQSVIEAQEAERQRIARDLHDGVGQLLAAAVINLARVRDMIEPEVTMRGGTGPRVLIERSVEILARIVVDVRTISHALGTSTLREYGLCAALNEMFIHLDSSNSPHFELVCATMDERLPEAIEIGLFRMTQELISNVLRHADASEATVQILRHEQEIRLSVEDNGVGFDLAARRRGMGLHNIAVRAATLGAELHCDSTPGHGTTVTMVVPLAEPALQDEPDVDDLLARRKTEFGI